MKRNTDNRKNAQSIQVLNKEHMKIIAILNEKRKWKSKKHEDWQTIGRDKRCGKENEKIKREIF